MWHRNALKAYVPEQTRQPMTVCSALVCNWQETIGVFSYVLSWAGDDYKYHGHIDASLEHDMTMEYNRVQNTVYDHLYFRCSSYQLIPTVEFYITHP